MGCGGTSQAVKVVAPVPGNIPDTRPPEPKEEPVVKLMQLEEFVEKTSVENNRSPLEIRNLGTEFGALVDKWVKPSAVLIFTEVSASTDIRTGLLNDHHFTSALSAVDTSMLRELIEVPEKFKTDCEEEYAVTFFHCGRKMVIVVDNYFPALEGGQWAFSSCAREREIWPQIFEKAYAKLHGGYQYIVEGRIDYALATLTGGEPYTVEIEIDPIRNVAWNNIKELIEENHIVVAETPPPAPDDPTSSVAGIIQGVGYKVIRCEELEGEKVVRLQHPYGSRGVTWRGEWAKKTQKYGLAKPEFFMPFRTFLTEFKRYSVCLLFDDSWKRASVEVHATQPRIQDVWRTEMVWSRDQTAQREGQKTRASLKYAMKIEEKCGLYVSITQTQLRSTSKGVYDVAFAVQAGETKEIYRSGKGTDDAIIGKLLFLDSDLVFPLTLTTECGGYEMVQRYGGRKTRRSGQRMKVWW